MPQSDLRVTRWIEAFYVLLKKIAVCFVAACLLLSGVPCAAAQTQTTLAVDVTQLSVAQLQQAVDDGYLTYEIIMRVYLARMEAYADLFNCVITVNEDALDEAKSCDALYAAQGRTSLLFGIPVVVKDNIDVAGMPTTAGVSELLDNYPQADADVVVSLKAAGAIILAKTNMDQLAFSAYTSTSDFGTVNNAFDTAYSAYGSSGGSAVCVAARLAPLALGTDTACSVRAPASANGVVGLRPTQGALSTQGVVPYDTVRDTVGLMAAAVEDCAVLYDLLDGDAETAALDADALDGSSIGVIMQLLGEDGDYLIEDEILSAFNETLALICAAGATLIYIDDILDDDFQARIEQTVSGWTIVGALGNYLACHTAAITDYASLCSCVPELNGYYSENTAEDMTAAVALQTELRAYVESKMDGYGVDAVVYPTLRVAVITHAQTQIYSSSTEIAPAAGLPALTLPIGTDADGLPIGLEMLARADDEQTLFNLAYSLEQTLQLSLQTSLAPSLYVVSDSLRALIDTFENDDSLPQTWRSAVSDWLSAAYYNETDADATAASFLAAAYVSDGVRVAASTQRSRAATVILCVVWTAAALFALYALWLLAAMLGGRGKKRRRRRRARRY
ncbi:MAG: amidase [Oscillospiraceae bacterium]|nr:amidase [Oscillospiraceae bacterium]